MSYQNGIELEIGNITMNAVAEAVRSAGGLLLNTARGDNRVYGYHSSPATFNGVDYTDSKNTEVPVWRIESDSSISGPEEGCSNGMGLNFKGVGELISPIIYGASGNKHILKVVLRLKRAGAVMTRRMGAHITLGLNNNSRWARFSDTKKQRVAFRLAQTYKHFEGVFDAISPNTRQMIPRDAPSYGYCSRVNMDRPFSNRTSALNMRRFIQQGIVEFRQPGHTLQTKNIEGWLKIVNAVVASAMNDNKDTKRGERSMTCDITNYPQTVEGMMDFLNPGTKTEEWTVSRVMHLATTYRQNRTHRMACLETQEVA